MIKSGKSFVKIGSRLQIAPFHLFLFYPYFQPNPPLAYSDPVPHPPRAYFILLNVLTPPPPLPRHPAY